MVFHNIEDVKYPFLHNALSIIAKMHTVKSIYLDPNGELCLTIVGKLSANAVRFILLHILAPWDLGVENREPSAPLDFSYSDDMLLTYIYSPEGIDYRNL